MCNIWQQLYDFFLQPDTASYLSRVRERRFYGEYAFVLNISRFQNYLALCLLAYLTVKPVSNMYKNQGKVEWCSY